MRATGDTTRQHDQVNRVLALVVKRTSSKGQHGDMRHDDSDRWQHGKARVSRATGGTTTAMGDTARRHDKGDARQTTTIRYLILMRLAED